MFYLNDNTQNVKQSSTGMARQLMRNSKKKLQGRLRKIYLSNKLRQLLKRVSVVAQSICEGQVCTAHSIKKSVTDKGKLFFTGSILM